MMKEGKKERMEKIKKRRPLRGGPSYIRFRVCYRVLRVSLAGPTVIVTSRMAAESAAGVQAGSVTGVQAGSEAGVQAGSEAALDAERPRELIAAAELAGAPASGESVSRDASGPSERMMSWA